ncbi:MAG TPA: amino acid permease [Chthoniobacterales bacterium]|nr:amino acid permease [Chthoniobacterales bacterium]
MRPSDPEPNHDGGLVRALGVAGLAANIVNTTIGAGIFVLPASVALLMGAAAPLAFVVCAAAMGLMVTSFALAGSRVSVTGGIFGYAETAFGRYFGFIAGALLFINACLGVSSVGSAFTGFVGKVFPVMANQTAKMLLLLVVFTVLAAINIRGVKSGARAVGTVTIAKLIPIFVFIGAGLFFIRPELIAWPGWPGAKPLGESVLLLVFAFSGIEIALAPSGEVKNPARTVPRAIFGALLTTTLLYIGIQFVTQGVLGADMPQHKEAPLAEAASRFLGTAGVLLISVGAIVSAFGFITSDMLSSPRTLYALSSDGIVPTFFARVHPRFRTPYVAIITYAVITYLLAFSSTFEQLVVLSNVTLLLLYLLGCSSALVLMRRDVRTAGEPLHFPGAVAVPILASVVIIWILSHATAKELGLSAAYLGLASVLYVFRRRFAPASGVPPG